MANRSVSWHNMDSKKCFAECKSADCGLAPAEAARRLAEHGPNLLAEKEKVHPIFRFFGLFDNILIWLLMAAAVISFIIGDWKDSAVIMTVIILNAILGFIQEGRGERAMDALKNLSDPRANVVRGGKEVTIKASELVPGDVMVLEEGVRIPADSRIVCANALDVDESALTGESQAVRKNPDKVPEKTPLSDRTDMVFAGTTVVHGNGTVLVVDTGMKTEIGKIATMVQDVEEVETPLQKRLDKLGKQIAIYAGIICVLVLVVGVIDGRNDIANEMKESDKIITPTMNTILLTSISLAVAVVPEGLPAIVTVALALGFQEMAKRNAIVRKLNAVETLGSTTVICTDKTGTLTKNEITVKKIVLPDGEVEVTGAGYDPDGALVYGKTKGYANFPEEIRLPLEILLKAGTLCNNARLNKEEGLWAVSGDPTEGSLLVLGRKAGMREGKTAAEQPRMREIPFDSDRKRMTTVHRTKTGAMVYMKGAPDEIINRSKWILIGSKERPFTPKMKWKYFAQNSDMARKAYRVLAFAYRPIRGDASDLDETDLEKDLVFVGLTGSVDPARPEVKPALDRCKMAGIKVIMITGDQPLTAMAVGRQIGLHAEEKNVLTGKELDDLSEPDFTRAVNDIEIYSRATPAHKLRIVSTLRKQGHVVAMTGDGVNDAPALRQADIGVAMGQKGTDVAREASDIVLTDDNFATIVAAIEEGRKIFNNIKRFMRYQLSTNVGAILLILLSVAFLLPLPLYPAEILYINIIIDGPPAMALAMEKTNADVMKRPPRRPNENILDPWMMFSIISIGTVMGIGTLLLFYAMDPSGNLDHARTAAFTVFVVFQLVNVINCRSDESSLFSRGFGSNKYVLWAVLGTFAVHMLVIYAPPLQGFFHTTSLTLTDWLWIFGIASSALVANEAVVRIKNSAMREQASAGR